MFGASFSFIYFPHSPFNLAFCLKTFRLHQSQRISLFYIFNTPQKRQYQPRQPHRIHFLSLRSYSSRQWNEGDSCEPARLLSMPWLTARPLCLTTVCQRFNGERRSWISILEPFHSVCLSVDESLPFISYPLLFSSSDSSLTAASGFATSSVTLPSAFVFCLSIDL